LNDFSTAQFFVACRFIIRNAIFFVKPKTFSIERFFNRSIFSIERFFSLLAVSLYETQFFLSSPKLFLLNDFSTAQFFVACRFIIRNAIFFVKRFQFPQTFFCFAVCVALPFHYTKRNFFCQSQSLVSHNDRCLLSSCIYYTVFKIFCQIPFSALCLIWKISVISLQDKDLADFFKKSPFFLKYKKYPTKHQMYPIALINPIYPMYFISKKRIEGSAGPKKGLFFIKNRVFL